MMSKRSYDKKLREEEEATAHVFQDFLTSFQETSSAPNKIFIKSGVLNPNQGNTTCEVQKNQIYLPKPLIQNNMTITKSAIECAKILKETKIEKTKNKERPRSNLELLKEEIKQRQTYKEELSSVTPSNYLDGYDPSSTNLFIANLNPKITEEELMLLFGKHGALASVKIMWPRGGDDKLRYTNCGFVAFMSRKDAERALKALKHRDDMRIGWGKSVEIPSQPIYVPPELTKLYLPPPYTGLPFSAQPIDPNYKKPTKLSEMQGLLSQSLIKVTIPLDKRIMSIIHRVVEFVVREGALFEAMIMTNEANNPDYTFLFEYKSPLHVYYRWKLYSILNGDGQKIWSTKPFRMFKNGPIWVPPVPIDYTTGMPDKLIQSEDKPENHSLSDAQCIRLVEIIKSLTVSKTKISAATAFCINHKSAVHDAIDVLFDSFKSSSTNPIKKIARIYLLSDILCNCKRKHVKIDQYETKLAENILEVFRNLQITYLNLKQVCDREHFKSRVLTVLRCWNARRIFSTNFITKLETSFLPSSELNEDDESSSDEPLDGASLLKRSMKINDPDVFSRTSTSDSITDKFVPSSWNRVDPKELESQAMSTQKLYELELERQEKERKKQLKSKTKKRKKKDEYPKTISSKWDDSDNDSLNDIENNLRIEEEKNCVVKF